MTKAQVRGHVCRRGGAVLVRLGTPARRYGPAVARRRGRWGSGGTGGGRRRARTVPPGWGRGRSVVSRMGLLGGGCGARSPGGRSRTLATIGSGPARARSAPVAPLI